MTTSTVFMTFLHDTMTARRITFDELLYELEGVSPAVVLTWLDENASPDLKTLPDIARALRTDLMEVAAGWLIDQLPELHEPLYEAVLKPIGSIFPRSDDLALRAPKRRRAGPAVDMGIDDPHDAERPLRDKTIIPDSRVRKRALTRVR